MKKIKSLYSSECRTLNERSIFSQLESYFENFWEPILILDSKFLINQVNGKFLDICGYLKDELLGHSPSMVLDQFEGVFPIQGNIKLDKASFEGKIVHSNVRSKYGIEIPVKMTFQPFYREIDEKDWFIAIFIRDISHEVHLKRQLNASKEFSLKTFQISSVVYRQTNLGPSVWVKDPYIPLINEKYKNEHDINDELIRIGLILTTALGQGSSYTLGLSELPVATYDLIAVCYTTLLNLNENMNKSYIIVAIFFPKVLTSFIEKRIVLENIFKEHFKNINHFDQIDGNWLYNLKHDLLLFDEGVLNS